MSHISKRALGPFLCIALAFTSACATWIAPYSLEAYKNATSLKAETLALVGDSADPFPQHADEVRALKVKMRAAEEFAAGMPKNSLSARQWAILNDPDGGLAGEYWSLWERQNTMSSAVSVEQAAQIADAFDEIICLEANKEKNTDCVPSE